MRLRAWVLAAACVGGLAGACSADHCQGFSAQPVASAQTNQDALNPQPDLPCDADRPAGTAGSPSSAAGAVGTGASGGATSGGGVGGTSSGGVGGTPSGGLGGASSGGLGGTSNGAGGASAGGSAGSNSSGGSSGSNSGGNSGAPIGAEAGMGGEPPSDAGAGGEAGAIVLYPTH